uniref:Glutaredoxin domain-containing protein n=1 Tax=Rhodosorus marinus TaxID=101924 RepID=A0A7S0BL63_9RHOD|mmetsp:Transcript_220/g.204  ORF Transcript_220/g.204 Transcript_220/m.204 type:complete len:124 (+) Transcript_220:234-605(+)
MARQVERKDEESIEEWIERVVKENAVVVYSKTYCPYCTMAKNEISAVRDVAGFKGAVIFEIDRMRDGNRIQQALAKKTGRRTVPNVFVNGKSVGGGDDVVRLSRTHKLSPMIRDAVSAVSVSA